VSALAIVRGEADEQAILFAPGHADRGRAAVVEQLDAAQPAVGVADGDLLGVAAVNSDVRDGD
jgi:hypothetical protein